MPNKYDNIINYNYVMKHKRMSMNNRAAQFAPFSALTGYSDIIKEKGRITTAKVDLLEDNQNILDLKLQIINNEISNKPRVSITYFIKDNKKTGGKYETVSDYIKRIDFTNHFIVLSNKIKINITDIVEINSQDINFNDIIDIS